MIVMIATLLVKSHLNQPVLSNEGRISVLRSRKALWPDIQYND